MSKGPNDYRWKQNCQRGVGHNEYYLDFGIFKLVVSYEGEFMSKGWEWALYVNRSYGKKGDPGERIKLYGTRVDFHEREQAQRYAVSQVKKYFRPAAKKFFKE